MQPDPSEDALNQFGRTVSNNGVIVPVEPSDLKNVWKIAEEIQEQHPKEHTSIDVRSFEAVCSPGANVMAVWYRASMLGMLAQSTGFLAPELPDDTKDVVFKVAARFPIKFMEPGVAYQGLPLDVQEFVKQVEDELQRLGFKI